MTLKSALCLLGLMAGTKADQPVHCVRDKIYGVWDFFVSSEQQSVSLFDTAEVCTHQLPNRIQLVTSDHKFAFEKSKKLRVTLNDDYTASGKWC